MANKCLQVTPAKTEKGQGKRGHYLFSQMMNRIKWKYSGATQTSGCPVNRKSLFLSYKHRLMGA